MFRLLFLLALAIFLVGSFGTSQNDSSKANKSLGKEINCKSVSLVGCGRDGKDGQNGKDGRDGLKGKDGRDGVNGKDGKDGQNGRDGRDGRDGPIGAKGEKGETGLPGQDGKGEKGSPGVKGPKGEKGIPGSCDAKSLSSMKSAFCSDDCSTGFHFFEKFQDLPTRGAVAVEHFTINGSLFLAFANFNGDIKKTKTSSMICKIDESTGSFSLYQTLQTRGAYGLEYFSIGNKHFLAFANYYDGTHQLDSTIYQWNGKLFDTFQKLSTNGATHFTYFKTHGEHYLAVANFYDGSAHSTNSVIYKWSSGKFNKFQDIPTEGAMGCTAFVINNDTFISFANHKNSRLNHSVQSTVFKWSGEHFAKLQSLQTYGTFNVKSFNINGHTFLAFANYFSGSKRNIDSFIYRWNGNKFVLFQSIPTRGAIAWHPFVIGSRTYLGLSNHEDDSQGYVTKSVVYQASGADFVKYQEIPTTGAHYMTSFEYKGHAYLAVANYYNGQKKNINSVLYKWV